MDKQCPTCGRVSQDWSAAETRNVDHGVKAKQHSSNEDRSTAYREWRRAFGGGLFCNDIDQLEWRIVNGFAVPVAVFELTRVDGNVTVPASYLAAILSRIRDRDPQAKVAIETARHLGVCAYIVAWRWDLSEFWVYNLTRDIGWKHWDRLQYKHWITCLKPMETVTA